MVLLLAPCLFSGCFGSLSSLGLLLATRGKIGAGVRRSCIESKKEDSVL